jgi:peptide/nickel transport system permease protein
VEAPTGGTQVEPNIGTLGEPKPQGIRRSLIVSTASRAWGKSGAVRAGALLLLLILLLCILVPILSPYDTTSFATLPFAPPSLAHPFGADDLGRDVFVRTFAAGRIDLVVSVIVVALSCVLGTIVGAWAGSSKRRWADTTVARGIDTLIAFPYLVIILVLVVIIGPNAQMGPIPRGLTPVLIAFLILGWTFYARLARADALTIRQRDYVVAAETLGYPRRRIVFRHILPVLIPGVVAYAVADVVITMGALAAFAFFGVGIQPPTPEWGAMMYEGRGYLQSAWWIIVFPGLILALTGFALSMLADGLLRDDD